MSEQYFDAANISAGAYQPIRPLLRASPTRRRGAREIALGQNLGDEEYFRNVAIVGPTGAGAPSDPMTAGVAISR